MSNEPITTFQVSGGIFTIRWSLYSQVMSPYGSIEVLFDDYNIIYWDWSQPMFLWSAANALQGVLSRPWSEEAVDLEKATLGDLVPLCGDANRIWSTELFDGASRFVFGDAETVVVVSNRWDEGWEFIPPRSVPPWHLARSRRQDMEFVVPEFARSVRSHKVE